MPQTSLKVNKSIDGEWLHEKVDRIINNKEPITDGAPIIYTERKEGINPDYDVRTDRWEYAVEAMQKVDKNNKARREQKHKKPEGTKVDNDPKNKDGGAEPVAGTEAKK